jgi:hypothetical protein
MRTPDGYHYHVISPQCSPVRLPYLPFYPLPFHAHRFTCTQYSSLIPIPSYLFPHLLHHVRFVFMYPGLRMTPDVFCLVMSQFPRYSSPWPHHVDEIDSAKSRSRPTRFPIKFSTLPTNNDQWPPAQVFATRAKATPGFRLNGRVCQAGGLSPSSTVPASSLSLRIYLFDCKIDGLLRWTRSPLFALMEANNASPRLDRCPELRALLRVKATLNICLRRSE